MVLIGCRVQLAEENGRRPLTSATLKSLKSHRRYARRLSFYSEALQKGAGCGY